MSDNHVLRRQFSLEEVSLAWECLANPPDSLPDSLKHLSNHDWHLLNLLLVQELAERDSSLLH